MIFLSYLAISQIDRLEKKKCQEAVSPGNTEVHALTNGRTDRHEVVNSYLDMSKNGKSQKWKSLSKGQCYVR